MLWLVQLFHHVIVSLKNTSILFCEIFLLILLSCISFLLCFVCFWSIFLIASGSFVRWSAFDLSGPPHIYLSFGASVVPVVERVIYESKCGWIDPHFIHRIVLPEFWRMLGMILNPKLPLIHSSESVCVRDIYKKRIQIKSLYVWLGERELIQSALSAQN